MKESKKTEERYTLYVVVGNAENDDDEIIASISSGASLS
jgi:hypothetical protein